MSEPTLIDARNRLQQKGFIEFVKGKRRAQSPVYTLLSLNNFSKNFSKSFSKNFSKTADTPLIGEKQKQKQKPPISPPKSEDAELPLETSGNGNSGKPNIPGKPEIEDIVKFYNDTCQSLRPVKILTDKRRAAVSARLREHQREQVPRHPRCRAPCPMAECDGLLVR